ncbi:SRPBCC family protein [Pseudomonas aeruginosa]
MGPAGRRLLPFEHGHMLLWSHWAQPRGPAGLRAPRRACPRLREARRLDDRELAQPCLYPNVYLMDQFSLQIRIARPLSVDRTEITIYCIAPKGESAEARARRIRQYEDFFNVSGMATPDDLEEFRSRQQGWPGQRGRLERPVARRRTLDRGRRRGGRGHRPAASPERRAHRRTKGCRMCSIATGRRRRRSP